MLFDILSATTDLEVQENIVQLLWDLECEAMGAARKASAAKGKLQVRKPQVSRGLGVFCSWALACGFRIGQYESSPVCKHARLCASLGHVPPFESVATDLINRLTCALPCLRTQDCRPDLRCIDAFLSLLERTNSAAIASHAIHFMYSFTHLPVPGPVLAGGWSVGGRAGGWARRVVYIVGFVRFTVSRLVGLNNHSKLQLLPRWLLSGVS